VVFPLAGVPRTYRFVSQLATEGSCCHTYLYKALFV
jgi:hypothetical protein